MSLKLPIANIASFCTVCAIDSHTRFNIEVEVNSGPAFLSCFHLKVDGIYFQLWSNSKGDIESNFNNEADKQKLLGPYLRHFFYHVVGQWLKICSYETKKPQ